MQKIKIYKEFLKVKIINFIKKKFGRLNTPMDMVLLTLAAYKKLPKPLTALELFSYFGLGHVVDYASYAEYLELWDIDPLYTKFAKKFFPKAKINTGDSIKAVKEGKLSRKNYNFIVLDSPVEEYGPGYCENFDLFPEIFNYIGEKGVLIITVAHNIKKYRDYRGIKEKISENWIEKRRKFFNLSSDYKDVFNIDAKYILNTYSNKAAKGFRKVEPFIIPRSSEVVYVVLCLER